jgi:hypothetical protein
MAAMWLGMKLSVFGSLGLGDLLAALPLSSVPRAPSPSYPSISYSVALGTQRGPKVAAQHSANEMESLPTIVVFDREQTSATFDLPSQPRRWSCPKKILNFPIRLSSLHFSTSQFLILDRKVFGLEQCRFRGCNVATNVVEGPRGSLPNCGSPYIRHSVRSSQEQGRASSVLGP